MNVINLKVGDFYENRGKAQTRRRIDRIAYGEKTYWYSENPRPDDPVIHFTTFRKRKDVWVEVDTGAIYMVSFGTWGRKIPARQEAIFPTIS